MTNRRKNTHRTSIALLALLCAAAATETPQALAQAPTWRPAELTVTGSKEQMWVVGSSAPQGDGLSEIRIWWCGPATSPKAKPVPGASAHLPPIDGNARAITANTDGLQILFTNDALWEYSFAQTGRMIALWKSQSTEPPIALAGDDSQPILWAVVDTAALKTTTTAPASDADSSSDDDANENSFENNFPPDPFLTPSSDAIPTTRRTLLRLRRGYWNRIPTFIELDKPERIWLAGRNEHAFAFWDDGAGAIQFAEYGGEKWDSPEKITASADVRCAWPGSTRNGPVLIAGIGKDIRTVQLHLFARSVQGEWTETGIVREGADYLTVDGLRIGVGVAMETLALARIGAGDRVEFATADPTGSPILNFTPLSTTTPTLEEDSPWQTMVLPMVVLGLMTFVLMIRRDDVMRPAAVPRGFTLAPPWKRGIATIIDAIPAFVLGGLLIYVVIPDITSRQDLTSMSDMFNSMSEMMKDPAVQTQLLIVHLIQIALYSLWCALWELGMGTTPGKLIFGCRVISMDGGAPAARQIILRNLMRFVTVCLGFMGILITFLSMVMMTRNTQRLGDVLGRTIVVEPGGPVDIPVAKPPQDPPSA